MTITAQDIEALGVHPYLGGEGQGWGIEQTPSELAAFLAAIPPIETALEIGTGYRASFSRFMTEILHWKVTSVDVVDYRHTLNGVDFIVMSNERPVFDRMFDLVFIDGNHEYDSVVADYEHYKPCAGKVIAFHDIAGLRQCEGAAKFWRELAYSKGKLRKAYHEAIADGDSRSGIGWTVLP